MSRDAQDIEFLKSLTVLYVEDDDLGRAQTEMFLKRRVGKLITAVNGAQGLEIFRAQPIQMVITDVLMPVMDGLAMAEEIRKLSATVPIIVTTAFEQTDYLLKSIEIGVEKYVVKPIRIERLEHALLDCAHRLLAEELFRQKVWLETEAQRLKHQESLRILTSGIAHDFNNLLQAILSAFTLAKMKLPPGSEAQRSLEIADRSSEQARVLARRLYTLAAGAEATDNLGAPDSVIQESVSAALAGTSTQAEFHFSAEPCPVRFNATGLRQVFTNMAINACEAMPDGGILVVSTGPQALAERELMPLPPGRYLHIQVQDTGSGIAPKDLPMIFEPYFSTKERGSQKGMGLGLALCDTLIRSQGGAIRAESVPGEGTTLHIYLPEVVPEAWPFRS
jgi:signal transduction histidine kinase